MMGKSKGKLSKEETEMILKTCKAYEAKLIELMGKDAFFEFSTEIARDLFADSILGMADSNFKTFCLDHFDQITENPFSSKQDELKSCANCKHSNKMITDEPCLNCSWLDKWEAQE